jgi:hypothetical protein
MDFAERQQEMNQQQVSEYMLHRSIISKQLRTWYEYFFVCTAFILLLKLSLSGSVPYLVPFTLLVAFQVIILIRTVYYLSESNWNDRFSKQELLIQIFTLFFFMYLTIMSYLPKPNLVFSMIPLFCQHCIFMIFKAKPVYKIQEFSYRIENWFKLSLSLTILFVGLKQFKLIPWNWFYIFWPVWIVILSLVLIGLGQLINGFRLIRLSCRNQRNCVESIGPLWLVYCLYGLAICFGYLFLSIALDNGDIEWVNTSSALLALLIYFIGLFVLTFLFNSILM